MIIYLKTQKEIEGFRIAGKIAGQIMNQLMESVMVGSTTNQINKKAIDLCKYYEVKPVFLGYEGFPAAICTSVNNQLVHGIPNDEQLKPNSIVSIDLGVDCYGFIGDTAVTIELRQDPNQGFSHIIAAGENCLAAGIKAARAGNKLKNIAEAINSCRANYSLPDNYGGHGIDRNKLHSAPFVANNPKHVKKDITLRAGMILAIEPMLINGSSKTKVSDDKWTVLADGLAVHFEHTILITDEEPEILTSRG